MPTLDDLLNEIFDGKRPAFYPEFESWVRTSRRFRTFASAHRVKIRTKLKHARDESGMQDLRAELEAAMLLLRDERFTLDYEKYAASRQRGPDFSVTFKTHTPFNVEVRRIRHADMDAGDADAYTGKLITVLVDKVGQMPPSVVNLLWLAAEGAISEDDLNRVNAALRQMAERKMDEFFSRRGHEGAAEFLRRYAQLSGIVVRQPGGIMIWLNALARHKTPPEIVNALRRLHDSKQ